MKALTPVKSSNVKAIGYDPAQKHLHVEFSSGGRYVYHDVSPAEHSFLMKAPSIGSHIHKFIKSQKKAVPWKA